MSAYETNTYEPGQPLPVPATRPADGLAITSMILGILWILGIGSALAVAIGGQVRSQERMTGQRSSPFALVGIILGWVGLAITALVLFVLAGNPGQP